MNTTIYALATPVGGALAVIRISGPQTAAVLSRVFSGDCTKPRYMQHGYVCAPDGEKIEECMAVFFAAPHSYTGEDMAELYIHGGQAVARRVMNAIGAVRLPSATSEHQKAPTLYGGDFCTSSPEGAAGAEPAAAGEFTKRAFLNGKMDLARAEAVMDVIAANTARAAQAAMAQLTGGLSARITRLEHAVLSALSALDAAIDYPEELEEDVNAALPETLAATLHETRTLMENGLRARVLREGARVVIAGAPNAGKSSLLNALLEQDRAIVTDLPGTTRDVLEEQISFGGVPARLMDTAGLRAQGDKAERQGVDRARAAIAGADLLLLCVDGAAPLSQESRALLQETAPLPRLVLCTKADLPPQSRDELAALCPDVLSLSAKTGAGLTILREAVTARLAPPESALVTNARHIDALSRATAALKNAQQATDMDCVATDLREAALALGEITGRAVDEAVIQRIFENFCVGK